MTLYMGECLPKKDIIEYLGTDSENEIINFIYNIENIKIKKAKADVLSYWSNGGLTFYYYAEGDSFHKKRITIEEIMDKNRKEGEYYQDSVT